MKKLCILLTTIFVLSACTMPGNVNDESLGGVQNYIHRWHDDEMNVTCWTVGTQSIDCIPDWQLRDPKGE